MTEKIKPLHSADALMEGIRSSAESELAKKQEESLQLEKNKTINDWVDKIFTNIIAEKISRKELSKIPNDNAIKALNILKEQLQKEYIPQDVEVIKLIIHSIIKYLGENPDLKDEAEFEEAVTDQIADALSNIPQISNAA